MLCGRHELPWDKMGELCTFLASSGFESELASLVIVKENFHDTRPPRKTGDEVMRLRILQDEQEFYWCEQLLKEKPTIRESLRTDDPGSDGQVPQPLHV